MEFEELDKKMDVEVDGFVENGKQYNIEIKEIRKYIMDNLYAQKNFDGNFTYGMDNIGATKRNLLNLDELIQLDNTKEIVILREKKPLLCDKYNYSEHRFAKKLKILSDDYEPEWKKE